MSKLQHFMIIGKGGGGVRLVETTNIQKRLYFDVQHCKFSSAAKPQTLIAVSPQTFIVSGGWGFAASDLNGLRRPGLRPKPHVWLFKLFLPRPPPPPFEIPAYATGHWSTQIRSKKLTKCAFLSIKILLKLKRPRLTFRSFRGWKIKHHAKQWLWPFL